MSIRLKDTIYDIINNSDKLDGYHRNNLYTSIPAWITATELSKGITVEGDSDKFYPVVISVSSSKEMPTFISIQKDLGTKTPSLSGNHSNGTSSLWLRYEMRNTMWDGNGGYIKTWYKYQGYATLVAHTRTDTKGHGGLIVWLRGGSCSYTISCTNSFNVNIYYSSTNIGSSDHPDNVAPMTSVDNGGIYTSTTLGYGNISGNASTATSAGKLTTARTISLTGSVTGSGSFDGSGNLSIATTTNHTHNYASTVKVGSTSYNSSSNVISLPAYPTLSSLGAAASGHNHDSSYAAKSHNHDGIYLKLSGGTLTGNFAANNNTKTPFNLTTNLYYVNKALNWSTSSYLRNVILLIPVQTSTNWSGYNYIDGKFLLWKSGGNVYDVVEVNLNNVYNSLEYRLLASGQHSSSYKLCICKYNGVSYYAIDCPYHANPYNNAEFYGHIRSSLTGGTDTVNLPLTVDYYNENTQTVLNSEVKNSITSTLTTSVVTSVISRNLFSIAGFSGSLSGNASTATKLQTARTISLTGSVTGSGSFDGSGNLSIATTTNHTHSYLPLSGGTLSGSGSGLLTINRTSGNPLIQFTANGTLVGFLGVNTSGAPIFVNKDTTSYNLLHSGNSSVSKSGETLTVKINGTTQSLTNTNTWRGITDSYSGTSTDTSLSQKGGKALYDALVNGYASSAGHASSADYASSAGNADTLDNYHAGSFGIWRGNVQTDPEADDTTYTTTADFLKQIHARTSIFNSNFSAFRGSWYYVGNVNYNTGVGSLEMAGTAVLNISGNCTNDVNYKSLMFLDRNGELFSYVSQESGVATWSKYAKSSEIKNATITIKQAGTSKGSFTLNQSSNVTIELTDSNTNTTYSAGSGLSLSGTKFNHASSVTAGTAGTSSATSGSTLAVPYVTVNATGHVTGYGTHTHTVSGFAASSHSHSSLTCNYNGGVKSNPQEYFSNTIGLKVAMTGHWSQWSDTLWINGYSGGDVNSMCALHFLRNGTPRMGISTQQNTATSYGTIYEVITGYNIANQSVNYANSAGSVAWGNITGKPSTFAPSSHNHNYLKGGPDNRSTNNSPSWYMTNLGAASIYTEFCQSGGANGNYENRTTFIPWGDQSGQRPVQLAFNNSGMFIRTAASDTAWNGWSGFSLAGHTHNYAGSSSAGGAANNSVKWGGYKIVVGSTGTATDTIYFVT